MQAMAHWMLATWAMVEPRAVVVMIAPVVMVWLAGVLDAVMVIVVDRWGSSSTAEGSEGGTMVVCCSATKGGFTGVFGQEGGGVLSGFLLGRSGLVVTHLGEYARSSVIK